MSVSLVENLSSAFVHSVTTLRLPTHAILDGARTPQEMSRIRHSAMQSVCHNDLTGALIGPPGGAIGCGAVSSA